MDVNTFSRINNGNTASNIQDRYDTTKPILNLLSTSHGRAHTENERTNKPLDHPGAFSQQISNLKLSNKNNPSSEHGDRPLHLQPQRRLLSQVPPRLSASYFSSSMPRKPSPISTTSPVVPINLQKTIDNTSDRASSPILTSQGSDDHAYTHFKRQKSLSPNIQASFRHSSLKRPDVRKSSTRTGSGYSAQATCTPKFDEALLLDQMSALLANKNQLQSQIDDCRSRIASTTLQLESVNAELLKTRNSFASSKERIAALEGERTSMTASLLEAKSELSVVSGDRERLREAHAQDRAENDQLRKRVEASKKAIAALRERCDGRDMDFAYLEKAHHGLCIAIDNAKKEAEEGKNLANNALAVMEPLIDCDITLKRAAETKAVLKELQDDLAGSQRVTDLLRDKLYNQSTLLVEARDRIRDLEEEKRSSLAELFQGRKEVSHNAELLTDVEKKLEELAVKVSSRELETIDILANSAALTTELEVLKKASEANDAEMAALRVIKEESISKLLASQDVINAREKEIVSLKAELKALGESKAESRALLAEAKKLLGEKEVELRAKDPNWDLEFKIKELNTQVASLKAALHSSQETLQTREIETQRKICDAERLNAELELFKTTTTKLQNDLEGFQSKEATATRNYEILSAEHERIRKKLQSQEQILLESKAELKERLEVQSVALFQAKEECSKLKIALAVAQEQRASVDVIVELHAQRALSAEKTVSSIEIQLKETQTMVVDLKSQLHHANAALKLTQETSIANEQTISSALHQRANELEKVVKDLEEKNDELSRRSANIFLRYQQGDMTDIERGFVACIMKQTQDIHEQGVVAKDNELRRRENMIQALQAKTVDMEMTIARMIKEKENLKQVGPTLAKSVVSLDRWLAESPADVETTMYSPEEGIIGQNLATPAALQVLSTLTNPSAPPKPSDPKFSQFDDDDSEDDVPLSDLSRVTTDDSLKRPRPLSPSVPDEEPTRSKRRTRDSILPQVPDEASSIAAPIVGTSSMVKKVTVTAMTATAKNKPKKRK